MSNKIGRPTEAIKNHVIKARIDNNTKNKLEMCVQLSQMSKSEIIRKGIQEIYIKLRSKEI